MAVALAFEREGGVRKLVPTPSLLQTFLVGPVGNLRPIGNRPVKQFRILYEGDYQSASGYQPAPLKIECANRTPFGAPGVRWRWSLDSLRRPRMPDCRCSWSGWPAGNDSGYLKTETSMSRRSAP